MRKLFILLTLAFSLQQAGSVNAQIPLRYRDTTVALGSSIVLGLHAPPAPLALMDNFSPVLQIGFPFVFFGTSYTKCVLSGNNFLSFDTALAGTYSHFVYDAPQYPGNFNKAILFPFHDVAPQMGGYISYMTTGTMPNRKFIVNFCKIPLFFCGAIPRVTDQLILNEGSNDIEMHITNKPSGCTFDNGTAIQGIRNGTTAFFVAGRNLPHVQWSAINEATRFTPTGTNNYTISTTTFQPWHSLNSMALNQVAWYDENNVLMGTGTAVTVSPGVNTHYYTARYTGLTGCDSIIRTFIDTVHVQVNMPLPQHLLDFAIRTEGVSHLLSWKTTGENPGERYILQHSTDARNYNDIYETGVQSHLRGNYSYLNENTEPGDNFYRLRLLAADGQQMLSQVVQMYFNDKGENMWSVYPNPAGDQVNISSNKGLRLQKIILLDVTGHVKYRKEISVNTGVHTISLKEIPAGIYYLKGITDKGVVTKSITVTKP